jgi:hypothetical protein
MSSVSAIPLWGRAWKLSVKLTTGDVQVLSRSAWDPEALRVTFEVLETTLPSPFWFADVTVYNLNDAEMQNLIYNAAWLTLEAGYQDGPTKSAIIWDGPVLQVLYDRVGVVDLTMHFNCMAGPWLLEQDFVNRSVGPMSSQLDVLSNMIQQKQGNIKEQVSSQASNMLQAKQYPRGKTIFGKLPKYVVQMSDEHFLSTFIKGNQPYLTALYDPAAPLTPDLIYAPQFPPNQTAAQTDPEITRSLIGVPKQSPFGVIFTVLLDPRLHVGLPPLLVKLDQTVISQMKLQYGQVLTPLDQSGEYVVAQVRHHGDSRGTDFYTEVTGYKRGYCQGLLNGTFVAQAAGVK